MSVYTFKLPKHAVPGSTLPLISPEGAQFEVVVPESACPGELWNVFYEVTDLNVQAPYAYEQYVSINTPDRTWIQIPWPEGVVPGSEFQYKYVKPQTIYVYQDDNTIQANKERKEKKERKSKKEKKEKITSATAIPVPIETAYGDDLFGDNSYGNTATNQSYDNAYAGSSNPSYAGSSGKVYGDPSGDTSYGKASGKTLMMTSQMSGRSTSSATNENSTEDPVAPVPSISEEISPSGRADTKLEEGLTGNVESLLETREQVLSRVLVEGEQVVAEFNCSFPTLMMPIWKMVCWTLACLPFYPFLLLFRCIRRWCYRNRCCTPAVVQFHNGKLAVTNFGRLICWKQGAMQHKDKSSFCCGFIPCPCGSCFLCCLTCGISSLVNCCVRICALICCRELCAAPVHFEVELETKLYSASNIRQINLNYNAIPCCESWCCLPACCCNDYKCSVEICFENFQNSSMTFGGRSNESPVSVGSQYANMVDTFFELSLGAFERLLGLSSKTHSLYIHSDASDRVHNGNLHSVLKDLTELHSKVLAVLPTELPDVFFRHPGIELWKFSLTDKFKNLTVVSDNGIVEIPTEWISLIHGETVINTYGDVYTSTVHDQWMNLCSCGWNYCWKIHKLKKSRVAYILTNKRLIVFEIHQRAGMIPFHLSRFGVSMHSYFPKSINGGYIFTNGKLKIRTGILTDAGDLNIEFKHFCLTAGRFAKSLQMATKRREFKLDLPASLPRSNHELSAPELSRIPLIPGETIEVALHGQREFIPFFMSNWRSLISYEDAESLLKNCIICPCGLCCDYYVCYCNCYCCADMHPRRYCAKDVVGSVIFPYLIYIITCCLRPYQGETKILLSNSSIFYYTKQGNQGVCGCCGSWAPLCSCLEPAISGDALVCARVGVTSISWSTIDSMIGHDVSVEATGKENCCRRCCACLQCGKLCCPMNKSTYEIKTAIQPIPENPSINFDYVVKGDKIPMLEQLTANGNWYKTKFLSAALRGLTEVQMLLSRHNRHGNSAQPKKDDDKYDEENPEAPLLGTQSETTTSSSFRTSSQPISNSNVFSSVTSNHYDNFTPSPGYSNNPYSKNDNDSSVINLGGGAINPMMSENQLFVDYDEL